eukprot:7183989-Prymnesium_polylepis.1
MVRVLACFVYFCVFLRAGLSETERLRRLQEVCERLSEEKRAVWVSKVEMSLATAQTSVVRALRDDVKSGRLDVTSTGFCELLGGELERAARDRLATICPSM